MLSEILKEFDEKFECWDRCSDQLGTGKCDCPKSEFLPFLRSSIEKILDEVKLEEKQPLKGQDFDMYADGYHSAIVDLEAKLKSLRV